MPLETPLSEVMDATQIERGQELGTLIYAVQSWTQQVWLMERKLESFQRDAAVQSPESQPAPPQDAQGQERAIPDVEWLAGYGPEALLLGRQARFEYCATLTGILRQATLTTRFQSPDGQQVPPEAPRQDPESEPPVEQHIDTPDELLELLAGISSDPQVEGLSLAQKASTIALLHIAKAVQQIAYQLEDIDTALEQIGIRISDGPVDPQAGPEGRRGTGQKPDAPTFDATVLEGKDTAAWESWAEGLPGLARKFAWTLIAASNRAGMPPAAVQSPGSPQEPS
jgi:hypothetical protein